MKGSQFIYESEKNFQEIKELNKEKLEQKQQIKAQRTVMLISVIIFAIFSIMFILLVIQKKKLSQAYKDLFLRSNAILAKDKENQQIREGLENIILNLKKQLSDFSETGSVSSQNVESHYTQPDQDSYKQQSADKLTDKQKEHILSAVNQVINNTEAIYDCDFNIELLADMTGYNSKYLSKVINDTYQCNFRTFINEYRIKEAQKRLLNTKEYGNYTINAIAQSVGYKSHANFILLFKKHVGISPSAYQKMAKEYDSGNLLFHSMD